MNDTNQWSLKIINFFNDFVMKAFFFDRKK